MKPLPRIEGEVQRYQLGPDGDEWVKADDYAALNDYAALVQMERDSARAEIKRLQTRCEAAEKYIRSTRHTVESLPSGYMERIALEIFEEAMAETSSPRTVPVHRTGADGFVEDWTELQHVPAPITAPIFDPMEPGTVVTIADANGVPIWYRIEFCRRRPDGSLCDVGLRPLTAP